MCESLYLEGGREGEGGRDVFFVSPPHYDSRIQSRVTHARPKCLVQQPHILGQNVVYLSTVRAGIPRPHHIISLTLLHCGGYERCHRHRPQSLGGGGEGGNGGEEEVVVMREGGGGTNVMAMKDARRCFAACFFGRQGM